MSAVSLALLKQGPKTNFSFSGGSILLRLSCSSECIILVHFFFFYEWRKKLESQELCTISFFLNLIRENM